MAKLRGTDGILGWGSTPNGPEWLKKHIHSFVAIDAPFQVQDTRKYIKTLDMDEHQVLLSTRFLHSLKEMNLEVDLPPLNSMYCLTGNGYRYVTNASAKYMCNFLADDSTKVVRQKKYEQGADKKYHATAYLPFTSNRELIMDIIQIATSRDANLSESDELDPTPKSTLRA